MLRPALTLTVFAVFASCVCLTAAAQEPKSQPVVGKPVTSVMPHQSSEVPSVSVKALSDGSVRPRVNSTATSFRLPAPLSMTARQAMAGEFLRQWGTATGGKAGPSQVVVGIPVQDDNHDLLLTCAHPFVQGKGSLSFEWADIDNGVDGGTGYATFERTYEEHTGGLGSNPIFNVGAVILTFRAFAPRPHQTYIIDFAVSSSNGLAFYAGGWVRRGSLANNTVDPMYPSGMGTQVTNGHVIIPIVDLDATPYSGNYVIALQRGSDVHAMRFYSCEVTATTP